MKTSLKLLLGTVIGAGGILTIVYFAQAPKETGVTFTFALTQQNTSADADLSESTIILQGTGKHFSFQDVQIAGDYGCSVTEKEKFNFTDSLAEVYCYSAGSGRLFQAKETDSGDLEVLAYKMTEVPDYEHKTYSIEITDPTSIYSFDLLETQHIVK